ncbi:MAG: hypothetical protein CMO80_22260 [Verrucomicrobiales bacterium]|nr:hypothetical protein [Verrucomicrobiales bacterium]|tara:strand:+ start:41891 stop:44248 length:2358 start_codon:yes stop_codon:yes gene_type:complete
MAEDIARLSIRVNSLEASLAEKRLKGLGDQGVKTEKATNGLISTFVRFAGPAAAAAAAVGGLSKVINVTREFDVLNAQLITATGSAEGAAVAFEAIQDFATQTPYDLQQATEGFTKLVNLGLTPSQRAMVSYGDTASAMGKDLNQMVEAVADAATGEFERLKEFGIRSSRQGDQVKFTFKGVTETVKMNAADIEEYLIKLGENNFAGAMAERMKTLDGAISNLGDSWDAMFLTISNTGIGDTIESGVRLATDAIQEITDLIESGQLGAYFDAWTTQFESMGEGVADALSFITDLWSQVPDEWKQYGSEAIDSIIDVFKYLPLNIKTYVKLIGVELSSIAQYGKIYGEYAVEYFIAAFDKLVAKSKAYGKAIGEAIDPFGDGAFDLDAELARIDQKFKDSTEGRLKAAKAAADEQTQQRRDALTELFKERDAVIKTTEEKINAADKLRETYEKEREARRNAEGDKTAGFKSGGSGEGEEEPVAVNKDLDSVIKSLRTEEEAIQESYDRRLQIILDNTEEGSKQQQELKQRLDEKFAEEALGEFGESDSFEDELERINEEWEARRELILNNTQLTEEQRTELEEKLTKERNERVKALEDAKMQNTLGATSDLFGSLAGLAKTFGDEQSDTYKAMFAVSKAFSIAESIMAIQTGIANAAALPFPANIPAIGSVITATAGVLSTIQSTNFSGAYDQGGQIPAGSVGLVGEFGPELVSGPAQIMGRKQTMDAIRGQDAANDGGTKTVYEKTDLNLTVQGLYESPEQLILANRDLIVRVVSDAKRRMGESF